ncbi:sensor histidine kinase [Mobilicoccus caccae]|uniref:Histidine kinase n=1 Tax=Mobilicoccus caccae TaxID=1859295 RepID=A0ABQ6ILM7_9MICO|nr:sensor histidine kinase [Mobilicoccus caccae]GMA38829.1 histidine kinase [Mobilicoccus caccae]
MTTSPERPSLWSPRRWRRGRDTTVYASIFLVFTLFTVVDGWARGLVAGVGATLVVLVFCVWYMAGYLAAETPPVPWAAKIRPWPWMLGLIALVAIGLLFTDAALTLLTYVAAGGGALLRGRRSVAVIVGSGAVYVVIALLFGVPLGWAIGVGLWIAFIGFTVWGSLRLAKSEEALVAAREEKAALAVDLERERLARDLHDILGHSLTVVTVKAQLAGRLVDADPERAKSEIAEVERLARDALVDVRSTVRDYRRVSLSAELAGARRALAAAEVEDVEIPGAGDHVDSECRELFAWVIREGVTNVVRHADASRVTVRLGEREVEVEDDGRGSPAVGEYGSGLLGLTERARNAGAHLSVGPGRGGRGTLVRVAVDDTIGPVTRKGERP